MAESGRWPLARGPSRPRHAVPRQRRMQWYLGAVRTDGASWMEWSRRMQQPDEGDFTKHNAAEPPSARLLDLLRKLETVCATEVAAPPIQPEQSVDGDGGLPLTEELAATMHRLYKSRETPAATPGPYCRSCSLVHVCLPEATAKGDLATRWVERQLRSLQQEV